MGKKQQKQQASAFDTPNYESLTTLEEVDAEIERHKERLVGKDKLQARVKEEKKDFNSAINEQLKEIEEERLHEIDVLSALEQHKQLLANGGGTVIPLPPKLAKV